MYSWLVGNSSIATKEGGEREREIHFTTAAGSSGEMEKDGIRGE